MLPACSQSLIVSLLLGYSCFLAAQSRTAKNTAQRPSVSTARQQATPTATKFLTAIRNRDFEKWTECLAAYDNDQRRVRAMNPRVLWPEKSEAVKRAYKDYFEARLKSELPIKLKEPVLEDYIEMNQSLLYLPDSVFRILETRGDPSVSATVYVQIEYKAGEVILGDRSVRSLILSLSLDAGKLDGFLLTAIEPASLDLSISVVSGSLKFFPE